MDSGMVVSDNNTSTGLDEIGRTGIGYVPLRKLENISLEGYEAMVELLGSVGNPFTGRFIHKDWSNSGTYIQDVIRFSTDRERDVLHNYLLNAGTSFKRDMFGFSFEHDHVHVFHSCAFSSSQCKCKWRKDIPKEGQLITGRYVKRNLREWTTADALYVIIYFFYNKRGYREAWIAGERAGLENNRKYACTFYIFIYLTGTIILPVKRVQWQELEAEVRRILEPLGMQSGHDVLDRDQDASMPEESARSSKRRARHAPSKSVGNKSKWETILEQISTLLETTAICPLESIKSDPQFVSNMMLTDPNNRIHVDAAIVNWSYKINSWTLAQFYEMYQKSDPSNFIFSVSKQYMNSEESFNVIEKLLRYQFDDEEHKICSFLQNLVNVLDWQPDNYPEANTKCNTFLVYSPPSAGKNFFFDTVFTCLLNMGQLGTANKTNNFAFQDAANRRVILWNEPNYESSMTDYLKTLFEGGDTKVRVKMQGDTHVKRTPIIILTNNHVNFMSDTAFKDRIKQYKWKSAPFLKEYLFKPHPLVFFDILLHYKIKCNLQ